MKLSCLPVSLYSEIASGRTTIGEWFRTAARLGLDGADLSVAHLARPTPVLLDGLAREAADAGVDVAMLVTYTDFTHPDPDHRHVNSTSSGDGLTWPRDCGSAFCG